MRSQPTSYALLLVLVLLAAPCESLSPAMAQQNPRWDDQKREELRDTLRWVVVGETRFAQHDAEAILEDCENVYLSLEQDLPSDEWDDFLDFARRELNRFRESYDREKETWPETTDCDRLDDAEQELLKKGIVLWQGSPCCPSCTMSDFPLHLEELEKTNPGLHDRLRGYAYFVDQTMAEKLSEGSEIDIYLGYGSFAGSDNPDKPGYEDRALAIGREVVGQLQASGLVVEWNGDFSKKIGVRVDWKRRTLLR